VLTREVPVGTHSWKLKRRLHARALPGLLRALADALEGKAPAADWAELSGLPLQFHALDLEIRAEGQQAELNLKAEPNLKIGPGEAVAAPAHGAKQDSGAKREKYRQLKKGMQADFKALERAVGEGRLPSGEVVDSFLSRAEIMAGSAPGGSPPEAELARAGTVFLEDALALRTAWARNDISALGEVLGRLSRRKSACHAQFT
jgi:XXXCH domain-containing protein